MRQPRTCGGQVCLRTRCRRVPRVLAGRNGLAAPKEAAAAKAGPADKDRFADIPPINMRRTGSMRSDISASQPCCIMPDTALVFLLPGTNACSGVS